MPKFFAVVWYIVATVLLIWAASYVTIHAFREPLAAAGYAFVFIILFVVLFYGEGTDITVARLYDKDPDQLPEALRAGFNVLREADQKMFISGRQLLVVAAVVGMTLLCYNLSDVSRAFQNSDGLLVMKRLSAVLGDQGVRDAFTILFPTFFALWFAQLPPKFIAHEDPVRSYRWEPTRVTIRLSIFLGRTFHVEGPSQHVMDWTLWLLRKMSGEDVPGPAPAATPLRIDKLRPSREHYYALSATLRDGRALELVRVVMKIGRAGEVSVGEQLTFRAFADGFKHVSQKVVWEAPVKQSATVFVSKCPETVQHEIVGPTYNVVESDGPKRRYSVEWDCTLGRDLPVGESLEMFFAYSTEAGATPHETGQTDYYQYSVLRVPTARLIIEVRPEPDAGFILTKGHATAKTSEDDTINKKEASRVEVRADDGGYSYDVAYPLLSTNLRFCWEIAPVGTEQTPGTHGAEASPVTA
jgi:hypothetical protein